MPNQQKPSTKPQHIMPEKKFPKLIFVLLFLFFLVVVAEGVYYFYLRSDSELPTGIKSLNLPFLAGKKEETADEPLPTRPPEESDPDNKYFEGLDYYEERDGEKRLLMVVGFVGEIDLESKTVTLTREGAEKTLQYNDGEEIILTKFEDELPLKQEEISFEEIEVGNFLAYNPVDESVRRLRPVWVVQRR